MKKKIKKSGMKRYICDGCKRGRQIWKNLKGKKYCKSCWSCQKPQLKPIVRQKPLPRRSSKKIIQDKEYSQKRRIFLELKPNCEARLPGCSLQGTQVHHKAGRIGDLYLDERYWFSVCAHCHKWITENSKESIQKGFSLPRL